MKQDIRNFVKIGNYIADESMKISLKYFKNKLKVQSKDLESFDPVTIADISIQKKINRIKEVKRSDGFPVYGEKQVLNLQLIEKMLVVEKEKQKQLKFNVMARETEVGKKFIWVK